MNINNLNLIDRLDVFVKILYVKAYIENNHFDFYQKLYQKHIKLYNGCIEEHKSKIDDFENDFQELILNIKEKGFDKNHPIPIDKNGEILNGAHRLSCCIYFGIEPLFEIKEGNLIKWGFDWFKNNNFSENELLEILGCYTEYFKDYCIIIIWPTLILKTEEIKKDILKTSEIIGDVNINFKNKNNFNEFVYDIYSYDNDFIFTPLGFEEKAQYFSSIGTSIQLLLINIKSETFYETKKQIREKYLNDTGIKEKEKSIFYTFHSSDTTQEANYLSKLILNRTNIFYLKLRNFAYRKAFLERLNNFYEYLKENNINKTDICLVGSTPLELFNLDKTSDIDYIYKTNDNKGVVKKTTIFDLLDYNYHPKLSNYNIIENKNYHFYFRGFKFISLELLKEVKMLGLRDKDLNHVKTIDNFLKNKITNKIEIIDKVKLGIFFFKRRLLIKSLTFSRLITKKLGIYKKLSYLWRKYILKNIK